MTRKNLSDVLQNEVQSPTPEEATNETLKLQEQLKKSKQKEDALQKEVQQLKTELANQNTQIINLKTELESMAKLKTDFAEAKDMILKLTEASQKSSKYIYAPQVKSETDIGSWLG